MRGEDSAARAHLKCCNRHVSTPKKLIPRPVDDELSEDALEQISGGAGVGGSAGPSKVA
jgi:bacteriocin-like protein